MNFIFMKKAQGLPVNIVVMIIIGILIFGLGLSLFSKMFSAGEDQVGDLSQELLSDLQGLSCPGGEWLCATDLSIEEGGEGLSSVLVTNLGESSNDFSITLSSTSDDISTPNAIEYSKEGCGSLNIYPYLGEVSIQAGSSAKIPVKVFSQASLKECSYIIEVSLNCVDSTSCEASGQTTPLLVRVGN